MLPSKLFSLEDSEFAHYVEILGLEIHKALLALLLSLPAEVNAVNLLVSSLYLLLKASALRLF